MGGAGRAVATPRPMRSCATRSSAQLRAALPVDAVVLGLHGAMVAQGYDDCEGDLLERVRAIVGPKVLVAAELDPHSHLTKKRVANADILAASRNFRTPISTSAANMSSISRLRALARRNPARRWRPSTAG